MGLPFKRDEVIGEWKKPEGKTLLGRPRRRWEVILRWIFRKRDVWAWNGSSWLRTKTGGGHL
jgi:hypothetical protein